MTVDPGARGAMRDDEVPASLTSLPIFQSMPSEEIDWLLRRGEVRHYAVGDTIRRAGDPIEEMNIVLGGRASLYVNRGAGWRHVIDVARGYVAGVVPYSRMQNAPGNVVVEEDATLLNLHQRHFADMIGECPRITTALVHQMLDRAREFRTLQMHDERLLALGKLASGLAHELNNPASGASSGARALASLLNEAERASRALAAAGLSEAQLEAMDGLRTACRRSAPELGALEAAAREDELADWLESHGADPAAAVALAASDVDLASLDSLATAIPPEALDVVVKWVTSGSAAREVARQIQTATARIHDLVQSVKGFTFMDREAVPGDVDVAKGLADTVAMLEAKSRAKSIELNAETADELPAVFGYGSEINQVWETLIDNAIDAVGREGSVTVTARARDGSILVGVADNGPGIPEEHRSRVFDPFYTTKPVGIGTGLGLYQARRIVHSHHGDIDFASQPGRTVFRVRLPVTGVSNAEVEATGATR